MARKSTLWLWLAVWFALAQFARMQIARVYVPPFPPVTSLVPTAELATDVGALMLGAHRLAADIGYIQFLQYYGQGAEEHHHHEGKHAETLAEFERHHGPARADNSDGGQFLKLQEYGRRILFLDPYFHTAILEISGGLAFNQLRISEALDLLTKAVELDPTFYRYRLYLAAILYKNSSEDKKLIQVLAEAIQYPDCPPMIENVLGNLLKKYGLYVDAVRVYKHTYDTSANYGDRHTAYRNLQKVFEEHPEILPQIGFDPRQLPLK